MSGIEINFINLKINLIFSLNPEMCVKLKQSVCRILNSQSEAGKYERTLIGQNPGCDIQKVKKRADEAEMKIVNHGYSD